MKAIHAGSGLLAVTFTLAFFVSGNAVSENSAISQTDSKPHSVSIETSHPLAMVHQQLEQARDHYQKGEIDKVNKNLQAASKWLQGQQKTRKLQNWRVKFSSCRKKSTILQKNTKEPFHASGIGVVL